VADEVLRGSGPVSAGVVEFVPTVSSSQAELACRWAEQRRQALEVRYVTPPSSGAAEMLLVRVGHTTK